MGQGIVGFVAETWQTVNIPDAYCDKRYDPTQEPLNVMQPLPCGPTCSQPIQQEL